MNKPLIDQMVDRFLGWKLPEDFNPDDGRPCDSQHLIADIDAALNSPE